MSLKRYKKRAYLADARYKIFHNDYVLAKTSFERAENEPTKFMYV